MSSSEWKNAKLGEIADFKTGRLNSNAAEVNGRYPFFTCSPETFRINSYAFDCEAAILAGNNANGVFALKYYKGKFNAYQRTYVITVDPEKVNIEFVYYQMGLRLQGLENISHGTATKYLTLPLLNEIEINLPPLFVQHRIADILSALDEKIELNRQTNATLEAIAQSIFKEWFVDFNFPGATGEMVESALGLIPSGWRVGKLGDVVDVKGGTTPSTKDERFWNGEHYWATPKDLSNLHSPVLLTTERKITADGVKQIGSGILPPGTLLLSSRAPIGYLAISDIPVSINQGFIAINAVETSNFFILYWLKNNMETIVSRANGSTFLEISKTSFREIELIVPDEQTTQKFDDIIAPMFDQIKNNEKESLTLTTLRDALLPKLMNGEIAL